MAIKQLSSISDVTGAKLNEGASTLERRPAANFLMPRGFIFGVLAASDEDGPLGCQLICCYARSGIEIQDKTPC